ncbi:MAG: hypothetical protein PUC86_04735 [Solobacterium sp.]|nr:hypothetical protein [Solobacterium sp.]
MKGVFFNYGNKQKNIKTSREDVERANPVFNTAKATVYQLAMSGNVDSINILEALKMTI